MISLNILYFYDFIITEVCLVFSLFCEMVMFAFELYCAHSFLWLALVHLAIPTDNCLCSSYQTINHNTWSLSTNIGLRQVVMKVLMLCDSWLSWNFSCLWDALWSSVTKTAGDRAATCYVGDGTSIMPREGVVDTFTRYAAGSFKQPAWQNATLGEMLQYGTVPCQRNRKRARRNTLPSS